LGAVARRGHRAAGRRTPPGPARGGARRAGVEAERRAPPAYRRRGARRRRCRRALRPARHGPARQRETRRMRGGRPRGRLALPLGAAAALFAILAAVPAAAVEVPDLYKAETIVTGTGAAERQRGFRETLAEVMVKASGDASLLGSARLESVLDHASDFVASWEQEDRMKGIPIHDEQGTRDRPFYLRVVFDKAKVDGALQALGLQPWS